MTESHPSSKQQPADWLTSDLDIDVLREGIRLLLAARVVVQAMSDEALKQAMSDEVQPCPVCDGRGWYADHQDECYAAGDCQGDCPIQRECGECQGAGIR